jgi:hypothetical protein
MEASMFAKYGKYLGVAGAALVAGLLLSGTPIRSFLPTLLLLACPIMMMFMMRGMGHGGHGGTAGNSSQGGQSDNCHGNHGPVRERDDAAAGR